MFPDGLRTLRAEYAHGAEIDDHRHAWGQLIYAASGAIHVSTPARSWLIPPARAVWLPPLAAHRLRMRGATRLRTLYVPPGRCVALPTAASGLAVPSLLRELILTLTALRYVRPEHPLEAALSQALLALIAEAELVPLVLTLPQERRALAVARAIEEDPSRDVSLVRLAGEHGATLRTLQRRFMSETGLPLAEWRAAARLMAAAAALLEGETVTQAALIAGYSGTSAFINAFRTRYGETPGAFRRANRGSERGMSSGPGPQAGSSLGSGAARPARAARRPEG